MTNFPSFLRFDTVKLWYGLNSQPIEEKCEFFLSHLLALKPALNAPITVAFWAGISQDDPTSFSNHFALLEHLRNGLLPTFNSSYRYEFHIHFHSDEDAIANVFASILQIPQINRCANVEVAIAECFPLKEQKLPIEAISKWLEVKRTSNFPPISIPNGMEIIDLGQKENLLELRSTRIEIQNAQELIEHLKKVFLKLQLNCYPPPLPSLQSKNHSLFSRSSFPVLAYQTTLFHSIILFV